jgi:hypothetical protein
MAEHQDLEQRLREASDVHLSITRDVATLVVLDGSSSEEVEHLAIEVIAVVNNEEARRNSARK